MRQCVVAWPKVGLLLAWLALPTPVPAASETTQESPAAISNSLSELPAPFDDEMPVTNAHPRTPYTLSFELGRQAGHVTYEIGGSDWWPLSRLEFPVDTLFGRLSASLPVGRMVRLRANAAFNVSAEAGAMKDSDWLPGGPTRTLDIFSASDAHLYAVLFDTRLQRRILSHKTWRLDAVVGYRYHDLRWECDNTRQWSPSGLPDLAFRSKPNLVAIRYDAVFHIPYLGATLTSRHDTFHATLSAACAPAIVARDRDDHVLRSILSETEMTGVAYLAEAQCGWRWRRNWTLVGTMDMLIVDSMRGAQHSVVYADTAEFYKGESWTISHQITSVLAGVRLGLVRSF